MHVHIQVYTGLSKSRIEGYIIYVYIPHFCDELGSHLFVTEYAHRELICLTLFILG